MLIQNLTSDYFILNQGLNLGPQDSLEFDAALYSGNSSLQSQIDNLYLDNKIEVFGQPEGFPLSVDEEPFSLPNTYELSQQDLVIMPEEGGIAAMSVDSNAEGINNGSVELYSAQGNSIKFKSYINSETAAMIEVEKTSNESGSLLLLKVNGNVVFQIGPNGEIAFSGVEAIEAPTVNPSTASAEDVANILVDLGLAKL